MKIQYAPGEQPLRNEHQGFTFIPSNYGQSALRGQRNDRKRYANQFRVMQFNQKCVRRWRTMSAEVKAAWETFAATYPQPSKKDQNVFLTGYQLFVKRNYYQFLHEGINADFINLPVLEELPEPDFHFEINDNGMCLDVTEWYLHNFGILPQVGDTIFCRVVPMAAGSGQFFATYQATLEVQEVFIDGLFVSLVINSPAAGLEFSVYLSRPVSPGKLYQSTKFRFMGCFKPTRFIQLTDTPISYEGQAGKFVIVNDDEDGVEFVEGGGGGVSCEDLEECAVIATMQDQINAIGSIVSLTENTSIPPVNYGFLYNGYIVKNESVSPILPIGWHFITSAEWDAFVVAIGGSITGGGALKETGLVYWNSPNTGASNLYGFNGRGCGIRGWDGSFSSFKNEMRLWVGWGSASTWQARYLSHNSDQIKSANQHLGYGCSLRPVKDSTTLSEGEKGFMVGNNGNIYRTIVIGGLEMLADNLAETLYRDKTPIPEITDNAEFWADTSGAFCVFNNDWSNV